MLGGGKRLIILSVLLAIALLTLPMNTFAAAVGQIKGKITDKETGEGVPGVSVRIVGTTMGAQTDIDGNYAILRLDPGKYDVKITSVEYQEVTVTGVVVNADMTTEVSQALVKQVADIGKEIVVTGTADVIDRYAVENKFTITSDEIKTKPVQNVDALLGQVAGVQTTQSGEVFIRGGRAGEVSYIVDGVPVGERVGGGGGQTGANLSLVSGSIQEIQIIKDGFDPEYGNALSGIVKITTATGSKDNTRINFQYLTDDLGNRSLNKYSWNYDFARFSISGPDPLFKSKILPALGLNFLEDKEFTYYFYGEVSKDNYPNQYDKFDTPITQKTYDNFNLFGLDVPERDRNQYYWMGNLKFRPRQNLKFILSYKNSTRDYTPFSWEFRYTPATAYVYHENWQSISLEVNQAVSKDMSYEAVLSYYTYERHIKPGDPNNPGKGLDPDQFLLESEWEDFTDVNGNGVYDAPEPVINLYPDSANYGTNFSGPYYTHTEDLFDYDVQSGSFSPSNFRFNNNGYIDDLEGEPFLDLNGNGVWDSGDILQDKNGNNLYDADRSSNINQKTPEPYIDGDRVIGEPFTDVNFNGVYDAGIDKFVKDADPAVNQDLNHNGKYDGPNDPWEPGIPYEDRNVNGIYDPPNYQYDAGEPFTDVNGNGTYDYGGTRTFLNPLTYNENAVWLYSSTKRYRAEIKAFRQMGNHELKGGFALVREAIEYQDITEPYLPYTGRPDGGQFPDRGAFRDMYSYQPWHGTVYLRDKLEYGSMIASLGLRWDFFIQDTKDLVEIARNDDLGSGVIYGDRQKLSPRIGFSYPISDKAKVHFNYGHFYQLPDYTYMYRRNTQSVDQNSVVGNYNLDYEKTVQYSFGVKYALSTDYSVDISGYFKDEFDKINSAAVRVGGLTRQQYRNSDYGRGRGFEFTLEKRGGGYVNGQINYTYAFAYGKASQANDNYLSDFYLSRTPLDEAPLDNDIRHSLKTAIQVYVPSSVKPRLFGLPIPNGWSLSVESIIESGAPYTPDRSYPNISTGSAEDIQRNSLRLPATAVFDVRFSKDFRMIGFDMQGIFWVQNIFDSKNVTYVYPTTGRPDTQQNQTQVIKGGTAFDLDPNNWDYGRQVRIGIEVNL